jgi:hypothetical protein
MLLRYNFGTLEIERKRIEKESGDGFSRPESG